jgi:hypothetical protein
MVSLTPEQQALVDRIGDLKERLVDFATSPPFERQLRAISRGLAAEASPSDDPYVMLVAAVEQLLFDFEYDNGTTVLDRFVRQPRLDEQDRALVEGFEDGFISLFEALDAAPGVVRSAMPWTISSTSSRPRSPAGSRT